MADVNKIDQTYRVPQRIADAARAKADAQDAERGDWPNPRDAEQGIPPWPDPHDPVLEFLLHQAQQRLAGGVDAREVCVLLAAHAWFEGGIENYDRGRRDAG